VHRSSAFLANYVENHDQARSISRWASDAPAHRRHAGRMLALFQCSLSGTLYCYQGQEVRLLRPRLYVYPTDVERFCRSG
jgi:glycosidase